MDPQAAFHLRELRRELLEHGFDRVEIEREVRDLDLEDGNDLDGRAVACVAITADGRTILAIEDALTGDLGGLAYTAELFTALCAAPQEPTS